MNLYPMYVSYYNDTIIRFWLIVMRSGNYFFTGLLKLPNQWILANNGSFNGAIKLGSFVKPARGQGKLLQHN